MQHEAEVKCCVFASSPKVKDMQGRHGETMFSNKSAAVEDHALAVEDCIGLSLFDPSLLGDLLISSGRIESSGATLSNALPTACM